MAVHFHPLRVKNIIRESPECVSITFDVPEELQPTFTYREGQNVTIKYKNRAEEIRRSYSICTAPHEQLLRIAVKKVEQGQFSSFANDQLKAGDILEVMPPTGKFNTKNSVGNYLFIAAGSGITPILSIVKHILVTQADSSITLFYGNKNRQSIIFFEDLEALKNKYMERFSCIHILSREHTDAPLHHGRIDADKLSGFSKVINFSLFTEAFLCGPEEMIFSSATFLERQGLAKEQIHFELFSTPGQAVAMKKTVTANTDRDQKSKVTVKIDGRSISFDLAYAGESVLDAALAQGADLPFACKGGVCCTCRAKLVQGKVHMDVNYALEKEEVAAGFILTCQSHPLSEEIEVDYDVR